MTQEQDELAHIVRETIPQAKVLVAGDPIADVYHFGSVTKISQEAPVPIFVEAVNERRSGGALNVIVNLQALGAPNRGFFPMTPWTEKHRYLVGHQQVFRIDADLEHPPLEMTEELETMMDWCDVAILSDYGKGCLGEAFCRLFIEGMKTRFKHVIVDPRGGDWEKYSGATVICPNEHEWAEHAADRTRQTKPVFPYSLLKLGAHGMQLGMGIVAKSSDIIWRSHTRARQVFDVTGAGDTVIATFAAAAAHGKDMRQAAELANMAAGVVVGKVGTATCSRDELLKEIDRG